MSIARDKAKKARRRALDAANPERIRIRRMIKNGELPKYKLEFTTDGKGRRRRTITKLKSTFQLLTAPAKSESPAKE